MQVNIPVPWILWMIRNHPNIHRPDTSGFFIVIYIFVFKVLYIKPISVCTQKKHWGLLRAAALAIDIGSKKPALWVLKIRGFTSKFIADFPNIVVNHSWDFHRLVSYRIYFPIMAINGKSILSQQARWWFHTLFFFTPTWGNDLIWLIFFRWVETTN